MASLKITENLRLAIPAQFHDAGSYISTLGDINLNDARSWAMLVVIVITIKKKHNIGVLL